MKRIFVCFIILLLAGVGAGARTVELTLHPAKAAQPAKKYPLLVSAEGQSDTDALLYVKAVQSLPKNVKTDQIRQWLKTPLDKLPRKQAEMTLQQLKPSLQLVEQAARYRKCQWPDEYKHKDKNINSYRKLAYVLALQAHLQIAEGQYDRAIGTIQTGLTMGNHIGQGPTLIQGMVGVAISAVMLNRVEDLIQVPDAPNLYRALRSLPKPFIDLNKQIEFEIANLKKYKNPLLRKQFEKQLKPAHDRIRFLMNRLDRHVAALQCVEALRLYAGSHDGKFPNKLSEITQVTIPSDPISEKSFIYRRTGSEAVLEGPPVEGIKSEDMISYKITLKE